MKYQHKADALDVLHASVKPGNGCWTVAAVTEKTLRGHHIPTGEFILRHELPKVHKRETPRAKRKAALARHNRQIREAAIEGNIHERNERRAELYARWLCERDGIAIPQGCHKVQFEHGWIETDRLPDAHWLERQRIKAVQFGRMVANDAPAPEHLHGRALRRWRSNQQYKVFQAELTVAIPHWDHVPVCVEGADIVPFAVAAE